jgi:serine O-acetyltransferase
MLGLIISDYTKYKKYGSGFISIIFFTQGFWATFQYRIAHSIYCKISNKTIRKLAMLPFYLWQKMVEIITGISIPAAAKIGHSFYIGHFGGIIINAAAIIGDNCNISQGVTIGVSGRGTKRGVPVLGSNIYIGANTVIAGKITVGNNCVIGAVSLVIDSIPDNAVGFGVPFEIKNYNGSNGYI